MPDSLEEFLKGKKSNSNLVVNGSLACQECNEIVHTGELNEQTMVLVYYCSSDHESKVKL